MRRLLVLAAAVAIAVAAAVSGSARGGHSVYARRAADADRALHRRLIDSRTNLYRERAGGSAQAHAWPASQAVSAEISLARLHAGAPASAKAARTAIARLERFRTGKLYSAWPDGDVYFDDNDWIARDFLDAHDTWGRSDDLAAAARIFAGVVKAWDRDATHPCTGGIKWTTAAGNTDRNTVTTANTAVIGLRLYTRTRQRSYLEWSQRMLGWLDRCMRAPDGLYWDHIDAAGRVDRTEWSYNQGSVIEANLLLHHINADSRALGRAEQLADTTLDALGGRWDSEPPEFAAVFFRSLLELAAVDGRARYLDAADAYGTRLWRRRDARSGLVRVAGGTRLLDQAAAVQVYAGLARAGR